METKWLTVQSFQRNQSLLDLINKLLIHFKLKMEGHDSMFSKDEINEAEQKIRLFLEKLTQLVKSLEDNKGEPLTGTDFRLRSLARNFVDAKGKRRKYKSILFKKSPQLVLEMLQNNQNSENLIDSLTELRTLVEEHISADSSEIFGHL